MSALKWGSRCTSAEVQQGGLRRESGVGIATERGHGERGVRWRKERGCIAVRRRKCIVWMG